MTPLVLIPGMMCDARLWGGVEADLGVPVHHHLPIGADSMAALAADLLQSAPPRFALAGLSLGGILAMEVLRQSPGRVERLALLDTNPRAETPDAQARRAPQIARALSGDLAGVMRDEMKPNYLAAGPDQPAILDLCMDMALSLGPEVFARQSRALRDRADQQHTLAGFRGPALVLMGADDRLCPRERHDLMNALMPQSRLCIVAGAGHLPPLERPSETTAALRDWLALAH
ncbi:alpha/beta fold hydrolase [Tabrizicola piscis]|uniref:Alpha/beta fold hydrolase n=1 Tax=Tabrizicola piscis TaxID=2494374 RepID=A0A3S8U3N1_9RHOB|nr:alpha/beta hydrolase [Tabrizicola piscis]AZL58232.1 alpha/beta fold hydrolase [Tabrizicola piscis]